MNRPFDRSSIEAEDLTYVRCIREVNRVWGLNPDTTERRGIRGYGEERVRYGIEQGNDLTERVITSRDRHSFIIAVSNYIRRVYVIKHRTIRMKQQSHGSNGWILVLVGINPGE